MSDVAVIFTSGSENHEYTFRRHAHDTILDLKKCILQIIQKGDLSYNLEKQVKSVQEFALTSRPGASESLPESALLASVPHTVYFAVVRHDSSLLSRFSVWRNTPTYAAASSP